MKLGTYHRYLTSKDMSYGTIQTPHSAVQHWLQATGHIVGITTVIYACLSTVMRPIEILLPLVTSCKVGEENSITNFVIERRFYLQYHPD